MSENSLPAITQKPLITPNEQQEFARLDRIVREGFRGMVEAGFALDLIRAKRLYRGNFSTFREYCNTFLELSPQYVGRLISAGRVRQEMETFVSNSNLTLDLPKSEAVLRELKRIKSVPERVAIYQQTAVASDKPPTAKEVSVAVERHLGTAVSTPEGDKIPRDWTADSDRVRVALSVLDDCEAGLLPEELLAACLRQSLEGTLEE